MQSANLSGIPGSWDDWVPQDRIRKFTEENKELAANLKAEMDRTLNPPKTKAAAAKRKAAGSDLSSARGSEERLTPMTGRGQKRGRDYEIEKVRERPYIASNSYIEAPQSRPVTRKAKAESAASQQALLPSVKRSPTELTSASPSTQEDSDDGPPSQRRRRANNPPEADPDFISFRRTRRPVDNRGYQNHAKTSMIAGFPMDDPPSDVVKSMEAKRLRLNKGRIAQNRETIIFTDKKPFLEQEESFHQRPAVHIPVPDRLKALLVDDWEYVTKNLSLIPLPAENPVNAIIDAYFEEEKGKRRLGSPEASILEEVVAGTKEYFERSLGKILLYRFERQQYFEARKHLEAGQDEWENKTIGDVYGAEHLARLFGMCILYQLDLHTLPCTADIAHQCPFPSLSLRPIWTNSR